MLKKYSLQLFEANKGNNIPDVPTEIFQEVKPIIDRDIISIDEEEYSENFYNSDDITIVKNELLPTNFKNEPELHNMIQEIIDKNIETIRQINGTDISTNLKHEQINIPESNLNKTNIEQVVQKGGVQQEEVQQTQQVCSLTVPVNNNEFAGINNLSTSTTDQVNESSTINPLDAAAFTLNYTNASFETFASYVAPSLTLASEPVVKTNGTSIAENLVNNFTRVLRQRKSICYKTMQKCLKEMDKSYGNYYFFNI